MFLDTAIVPTRHALYAKMALVGAVFALVFEQGLSWWQWLMMVVGVILCWQLDRVRSTPVRQLSAKSADDVWYLGVYDGDESQIWQGYLHGVERVGQALKLQFYIITPTEMTHKLIIHKGAVSEQDFCRLATLSWVKTWG